MAESSDVPEHCFFQAGYYVTLCACVTHIPSLLLSGTLSSHNISTSPRLFSLQLALQHHLYHLWSLVFLVLPGVISVSTMLKTIPDLSKCVGIWQQVNKTSGCVTPSIFIWNFGMMQRSLEWRLACSLNSPHLLIIILLVIVIFV